MDRRLKDGQSSGRLCVRPEESLEADPARDRDDLNLPALKLVVRPGVSGLGSVVGWRWRSSDVLLESERLCFSLEGREESLSNSSRATMRVAVGLMKDGAGNLGMSPLLLGGRRPSAAGWSGAASSAAEARRLDACFRREKIFSNRSMPWAMAAVTGHAVPAVISSVRGRKEVQPTRVGRRSQPSALHTYQARRGRGDVSVCCPSRLGAAVG